MRALIIRMVASGSPPTPAPRAPRPVRAGPVDAHLSLGGERRSLARRATSSALARPVPRSAGRCSAAPERSPGRACRPSPRRAPARRRADLPWPRLRRVSPGAAAGPATIRSRGAIHRRPRTATETSVRTAPVRLTSSTRSHCCQSSSSTGTGGGRTAAFATPWNGRSSSASARTAEGSSAWSATSARREATRPPAFCTVSTVAARPGSLMPTAAIDAPASDASRAVDRPMPLAAPVIGTTRPSRQ